MDAAFLGGHLITSMLFFLNADPPFPSQRQKIEKKVKSKGKKGRFYQKTMSAIWFSHSEFLATGDFLTGNAGFCTP